MTGVIDLPKTHKTSVTTIKKAAKFALETEACVILSDVAWETYNQFVQETMDKLVNPRFYFEKENLLIMPVLAKHERINRYIELLINILTEEFQIDCIGLGSTTFQREDIERGFEPDSCFYFKYEKEMRQKNKLNMTVDPAPELIVEVDITSLSTNRQSIFAAFGVPEIWRFDGEEMHILKLVGEKYEEVSGSLALPLITSEKLSEFTKSSENLSRLEWISSVRNWAKTVK